MAREPIPIHVGHESPSWWEAMNGHARLSAAASGGEVRSVNRPAVCEPDFPWGRLGVRPVWVGEDTSVCLAAIAPGVHNRHGGTDIERFLAACAARGEVGILVAALGEERRRLYGGGEDVSIPPFGLGVVIGGRGLPRGVKPVRAEGLGPPERDLALRLVDTDGPWWDIEIESEGADFPGDPVGQPTFHGELHPILVTRVGEIVAGVWVPHGGGYVVYLIPARSWELVLDWLVNQAIPAYNRSGLRRLRANELVDDRLLTAAEAAARDALEAHTAAALSRTSELEGQLAEARADADAIRYPLLDGTGGDFKIAVRRVLEVLGFGVEDLDERFPGRSADLLASRNGRHWLVEAKTAGGNAPESYVGDAKRHLATWPQLEPGVQLEGVVLVVSHQRNLLPTDRDLEAYRRREFVAALDIPVISALSLFEWWRRADTDAAWEAFAGEEG